MISTKSLKAWAAANLPARSTLREVLLTEPERLEINAFISKLGTWLRICEIEAPELAFSAQKGGASKSRREKQGGVTEG